MLIVSDASARSSSFTEHLLTAQLGWHVLLRTSSDASARRRVIHRTSSDALARWHVLRRTSCDAFIAPPWTSVESSHREKQFLTASFRLSHGYIALICATFPWARFLRGRSVSTRRVSVQTCTIKKMLDVGEECEVYFLFFSYPRSVLAHKAKCKTESKCLFLSTSTCIGVTKFSSVKFNVIES